MAITKICTEINDKRVIESPKCATPDSIISSVPLLVVDRRARNEAIRGASVGWAFGIIRTVKGAVTRLREPRA